MKRYGAPWSRSLTIWSAVFTAILVGAYLVARLSPDRAGIWLPLVILGGALLFTIRGYTVTKDQILVHRLLWATKLPRDGLVSVERSGDLLKGGFRTFGNGGLYSISGWFRSSKLGSYRAFVTDRSQTVVLRYSKRRPIVLSPDDPDAFIAELSKTLTP